MQSLNDVIYCQIQVFSESGESVKNFDLFSRRLPTQEWEKIKVNFNKSISVFEFTVEFPGITYFKVVAGGYIEEEQKIPLRPHTLNKIIFFLGSTETKYISVTNQKLFPAKPELNQISMAIRARTTKVETEKIIRDLAALGFKKIAQRNKGTEQFELEKGEIDKEMQKALRRIFDKYESVMHIGEVIHEQGKQAAILTSEVYVKFILKATEQEIKIVIKELNLEIVRKSSAGINSYILCSTVLTDKELLEQTKVIQEHPLVEKVDLNISYPAEEDIINPNDTLAAEQWDHLNYIHTPDAWQVLTNRGVTSFGASTIRVAVIDGGLDNNHPEFTGNLSDGVTPKIGTIFDFNNMVANLNNPIGTHGTNTSSAATGNANDNLGTAGIAGNCQLMGIQYNNGGVVAPDEDVFEWVGGFPAGIIGFPAPLANGADVISNSWGRPTGGINIQALIDVFELLTNFGRNGRGILMFFSAGNNNALFEPRRPYGREPRVMSITASTLTNLGRKEQFANYTNFGAGVSLCAPSSDGFGHNPPVNFGAQTATLRLGSPNQFNNTSTVGPGPLPVVAPPNSISVVGAGSLNLWTQVFFGVLGAANSEAHLIIGINAPNNFITLGAPFVNVPAPGTPITEFDGNMPGNFTVNTTLLAIVSATQITVVNPAGFRAGNAVFIEVPGTVGAESHAISSVVGNTINLVTSLLNPHLPGAPVAAGPADYNNNFGGTSYSTPVCAGISSLILSVNPKLTWVEVRQIMRDTAIKIDSGTTGVVVGGVRYGIWMDSSGNPVVTAAGMLNPLALAVNTTLSGPLTAAAAAANNPVIPLNPVAGFEAGQAIRINGGGNTEFSVIRSVGVGTITLAHRLVNGYNAGDNVNAGRKPYYSAIYGFGRVDANLAAAAAVDSLTNYRQLVVRNTLTDTGVAATVDVQSPDIWVDNKSLVTNGKTFTIRRNAVGLNDMAINSIWNLSVEAEIYIEIDGTGATDTFRWRIDRGAFINGVAILAAGNLISNGLIVTFAAVTGHKAWDNWTIYVDPTVPDLDYTKDAPHKNPDSTVQRFIHARIKNMVTGLLAVDYKNLDAWVRFYILANPAATPLNITFPTSFNTTTPVANLPTTDSAANTPNTITYFAGEVEIPAGTINPSNSVNPNDGVEIISVPWALADIPTVATTKDLYILVQVAPSDGELNGNTVLSNSSISYRQILFATFKYQNKARAVPLTRQFPVDSFGTVSSGDFAIDIATTIGRFTTEKIEIEVILQNDNATEEKAIYKYTGGAWAFDAANPAWSGLVMTVPVITGGAVPAAGSKTMVTFTGDFQAAKEHQKLTIKARVYSNVAGSTAVIAEQEHAMDIVEESELPTGISSSVAVLNPPPLSYAFADFTTLVQTNAQTYGPVSGSLSTKFRCTSLFTSASDVNAFAAVSGMVMVQPGSTADTVNLIVRPYQTANVGFTQVKYYIYRGLRKADFFDPVDDTKVLPVAATNSEFITRSRQIHTDQNASGADFLSKALGYDPPNQAAASLLDSYFFSAGGDFQLPFASKGQQLGKFFHSGSHEFGFEVILEEGNFPLPLSEVRSAEYIVDVSALPSGTDAEKFSLKLEREKILNFVDPAAFYGMHMDNNGKVEYRKPDNSKGNKSGTDIYTDIVSKFFTKNRLYIDIRNENSDSYNFYVNYKGAAVDPDVGKDLRVGTEWTSNDVNNLAATNYGNNSWPVHILDGTQNTAGTENKAFLAFRVDDNIKPIVLAGHGKVTMPAGTAVFVDDTKLLPGVANPPWTNTIGLEFPNTGAAAPKSNVATVIRISYARINDAATVWPDTVLKTVAQTDNIFGPIDTPTSWTGTEATKWVMAQDKKFVSTSPATGYAAERGLSYDAVTAIPGSGRAIFFGLAKDYFGVVGVGFQAATGLTGGVSTRGTFFEAASVFQNIKLDFDTLTIGADTVTTLKLTPRTGAAVSPSSMPICCISKAELDKLIALPGFNNSYPRYLTLVKIADLADTSGKNYTTFSLSVQGLDSAGKYKIVAPGVAITVYTVDQYMHFSKNFADAQPLPTTYIRNAEEYAGELLNPVNNLKWEDIHVNNDTFGAIGALAQQMPTLVTNFETAVNAVANDNNARDNLIVAIDTSAAAILARGRAGAANNSNGNADDRILYWARNRMKASLQSHEVMLQNFSTRTELLKRFEIKSRGLDSITFAAVPAGAKKVLLIGFDPAQVYPGNPTANVEQSNPSGAATLAMHGETIMNGAVSLASIQSVILPSRSYELSYKGGQGFIEEFLNKFIDPTDSSYTSIDMIIVVGHGKEWRFDIPRFSSRRRQQTVDNNFIVSQNFPLIPAGNPFYRTSLPVTKMVPAANGATTHNIYFNQTYAYADSTGTVRSNAVDNADGFIPVNNNPGGADPLNLLPTNANQNTIRNVSGGAFLSIDGEVFYRLCLLRENKNGAFITGMIAMPRIMGTNAHVLANPNVTLTFNAAKTKTAIDEFRAIIKKAFL